MTTRDGILIGVDSGGTKTLSCAVTVSGDLIGMGYGGPTNAIFVPEADTIHAMREAVAGALGVSAAEPVPVEEVTAVYLSAPGFGPDAAERALRPLCPRARIKVDGDAHAVFRGALPSGDGIVALSGTGSFTCGLWKGKWLTNGGWGPLLGDEGSGYWIGLEALKAVALAADGRGPATELQAILRRTLHYSFDEELRRFAYSKSLNRQRIAGLTVLVAQAAREGDDVAKSILVRAGYELAKMVKNLAARLGTDGERVPVSLTGGVARKDSLVVTSFRQNIEELVPGAVYAAPRFEPWVGAVLLAFQLADVDVGSEIAEKLEKTATVFTNSRVS